MAKFCNSHLKLNSNERIYFGDLDNASFTYDGSDLVVDVPIRGEKAVESYHLVRFDQLQDLQYSLNTSDWQESVLTISGSPPTSPSDGDRYLVGPGATGAWSGLDDYIVTYDADNTTWSGVMPNEGFTTFLEDANRYYLYYDGNWAPMGAGISHSDLVFLSADDHPQYILVDGSRGFTSTVSGVDPVLGSDLATKDYVDAAITAASGSHNDLVGLQGGTTNEYYHLTSDEYNSLTSTGGVEDASDMHTHDDRYYTETEIDTTLSGYVLVDGSRGFTGTISGIDPTQSYHLTTKQYVDDEIATLSGVLDGDFVTLDTTQTITGDKTFDNTLTTFLGDVFFDGINITMSGTTLTTEANAVFNYDSTATINNAGDTNYQSGSTVTFESGSTTTFEGDTNFESDIEFGSTTTSGLTLDFKDNTISGTGDIYAGNLYVDNIVNECDKWGRTAVISGATSQSVTFDTPFPDDDYTLVASLTNEIDSPPCIYSTIQGVKTASGFTTHFSGDIENGNYILEWHAKCGQSS